MSGCFVKPNKEKVDLSISYNVDQITRSQKKGFPLQPDFVISNYGSSLTRRDLLDIKNYKEQGIYYWGQNKLIIQGSGLSSRARSPTATGDDKGNMSLIDRLALDNVMTPPLVLMKGAHIHFRFELVSKIHNYESDVIRSNISGGTRASSLLMSDKSLDEKDRPMKIIDERSTWLAFDHKRQKALVTLRIYGGCVIDSMTPITQSEHDEKVREYVAARHGSLALSVLTQSMARREREANDILRKRCKYSFDRWYEVNYGDKEEEIQECRRRVKRVLVENDGEDETPQALDRDQQVEASEEGEIKPEDIGEDRIDDILRALAPGEELVVEGHLGCVLSCLGSYTVRVPVAFVNTVELIVFAYPAHVQVTETDLAIWCANRFNFMSFSITMLLGYVELMRSKVRLTSAVFDEMMDAGYTPDESLRIVRLIDDDEDDDIDPHLIQAPRLRVAGFDLFTVDRTLKTKSSGNFFSHICRILARFCHVSCRSPKAPYTRLFLDNLEDFKRQLVLNCAVSAPHSLLVSGAAEEPYDTKVERLLSHKFIGVLQPPTEDGGGESNLVEDKEERDSSGKGLHKKLVRFIQEMHLKQT